MIEIADSDFVQAAIATGQDVGITSWVHLVFAAAVFVVATVLTYTQWRSVAKALFTSTVAFVGCFSIAMLIHAAVGHHHEFDRVEVSGDAIAGSPNN